MYSLWICSPLGLGQAFNSFVIARTKMQLAATWLFNGLADKNNGIALPGNKSCPSMDRINALNLEATPGATEIILVRGPLKPPGKHDETEDEYNGTGTGK